MAAPMFLGGSLPFLMLLLVSFFSVHVPVGRYGYIYFGAFIPWDKATVVYDSEGVLQKLKTGNHWWSPTIAISPEHREQIQKLIQQSAAEEIQ